MSSTTNQLVDLAYGRASQLMLRGPVPTGVTENLRLLDRLDLLTDDLVWQLIAYPAIDPFFLIRMVRQHKTQLGLKDEENHHSRTLAFTTVDGQVSFAVDILTDDFVVMRLEDPPRVIHQMSGDALYDAVKDIPVGEERLAALLKIIAEALKKD